MSASFSLPELGLLENEGDNEGLLDGASEVLFEGVPVGIADGLATLQGQ